MGVDRKVGLYKCAEKSTFMTTSKIKSISIERNTRSVTSEETPFVLKRYRKNKCIAVE